jgi:hypothetical protein
MAVALAKAIDMVAAEAIYIVAPAKAGAHFKTAGFPLLPERRPVWVGFQQQSVDDCRAAATGISGQSKRSIG